MRRVGINEPYANNDEDRQRREFRDREQIDDQGALANAADIHPGEGERHRRDHHDAADPARHRRPVETQCEGHGVDDRSLSGDARDPLHPADFERDEAAKGGTGVKVGAAGAPEPASHLGETQRDQQRREPYGDKRDRPPVPDLRSELRGQDEHGAADHLVDADRRQVPFAEFAQQSGCRPGAWVNAWRS